MFLDIKNKDLGKIEKITINDFLHKNYKKEDKIRLELQYYYYYLFEIFDNPDFLDLYDSTCSGASGVLEKLIDLYFSSNEEDLEYLAYLLKKSPDILENIIEETGLFVEIEHSYVVVKLKDHGYVSFPKNRFFDFFGLNKSFILTIPNFISHIKKC